MKTLLSQCLNIIRFDTVALNRNLDKNRKANKVYISNQGATLWQKKVQMSIPEQITPWNRSKGNRRTG